MLRVVHKLQRLSIQNMDPIVQSPSNFQTVRWARKPIWMGTAKSKLFRVPKRPVIPVEEKEELQRLYNNYRTQMKSIRQFLYSKHSVELQAQADTEEIEKLFREDFIRCKEMNDKWNDEVRVSREKRVAEELERDIEFARNRLLNEMLKGEEKSRKAEEIVRREKEAAVSFITRATLDEAIERALTNITDYNFAIDLDGNRVVGRETNPTEASNNSIEPNNK